MTKVVVVVFDGMNEELVTPELMPNLSAFASSGVRTYSHRADAEIRGGFTRRRIHSHADHYGGSRSDSPTDTPQATLRP